MYNQIVRFLFAMAFVAIATGSVASAQQRDRFLSKATCEAAVKAGTAKWYQPSFFDHRNRPPSRPVATTRPLEERACVEMWIVGGWAWVPQPGVPQAGGDSAPKFDFDADGQPIRRSDCGNRVRKIVYVPVPPPKPALPSAPPPPPPAPKTEPAPPPPAAPARGDVNININITVPPPPPRWEEPKPRPEPAEVRRPRRKWPWVVGGLAAGAVAGGVWATRGGDGGRKPPVAVTGPGRT